jgi:hypothetical protein
MGPLALTGGDLGHEVSPAAAPFFRPGQPKRGCEFRGLSILENIPREWFKLAPD